jgi:chorismate mutase-like protein
MPKCLPAKSSQAQRAELSRLRKKIDQIDLKLLVLLAKRQQLTDQIGRLKSRLRLAVRDPRREVQMLQQQRAHVERLALDPALAEKVFHTILRLSRHAQRQVVRRRPKPHRSS